MNKLKMLTASTLILFVLAGCSAGDAQVNNEDEKLLTIGDKSLTKGEVFDKIKTNTAVGFIQTKVDNYILDKEVPITKEIEKEAKKSLESIKTLFKDNFEAYMKQSGYSDEKKFYEERILLSTRMAELSKKYVTNNSKELFKKYEPVKIKILEFTDKAKAEAAFKALSNGVEFELAGKENGATSSYDGREQIVNKSTSLPNIVFTGIDNLKENKAISPVLTDTENSKYYLVTMVEKDPSKFKEDAINNVASITEVNNKGFNSYLKKYKFDIYDQEIYDIMAANLPAYLGIEKDTTKQSEES